MSHQPSVPGINRSLSYWDTKYKEYIIQTDNSKIAVMLKTDDYECILNTEFRYSQLLDILR